MATTAGTGGGKAGSGAVRAGAAFVELFTNDSKLVRGLEAGRRRLARWGAATAKAGAVTLGAGAAGLTAAGVGVGSFLDRAGEVSKLAAKLGLPVDKLDAFAYAADQLGRVTLQELEGHFENFAERVKQGADGAGEAIDSFRKLNIDPRALAGLDQVDQFLAVADALDRVGNETERLGILSNFGGDQFQKLNAVFRGGSAAARGYMAEARELGIALTPAQAERAAAVQKELTRLWWVGRAAVAEFASAVLPSADTIRVYGGHLLAGAQAARQFAAANPLLVAGAVGLAAALAVGGAALMAFGGAMSGLAAAAGVAGAVLGVVFSKVGLAAAATAGLGYLWATQTESGKAFAAGLGAEFDTLKQTAVGTWQGVTDALKAGDLKLAGEVAMAGLTLAWRQGELGLAKGWAQFNKTFVDVFRDAMKGLQKVAAPFFNRMKADIEAAQKGLEKIPGFTGTPGAGKKSWLSAAEEIFPALMFRGALGIAPSMEIVKLLASVGKMGTDPKADPVFQQRTAALSAAQAAVDEAMANLDKLKAEAAGKAADAAKPKPNQTPGGRNLDLLVANLAKSTGAFLGGSSALQVFGQGRGDYGKQTVGELQKVNDKLGDLPANVGKAVANAMVFG